MVSVERNEWITNVRLAFTDQNSVVASIVQAFAVQSVPDFGKTNGNSFLMNCWNQSLKVIHRFSREN